MFRVIPSIVLRYRPKLRAGRSTIVSTTRLTHCNTPNRPIRGTIREGRKIGITEEVVMLVLTRKIGEKLIIADEIVVQVLSVSGDQVKIGIQAPTSVSIHRN